MLIFSKFKYLIAFFYFQFFMPTLLLAGFLTEAQTLEIQDKFSKMNSSQPSSDVAYGLISKKYLTKNDIFKLKDIPDLIFKLNADLEPISKRISLNEEARTIIDRYQLDRLVLPKTQLLRIKFADGKSQDIVVEEELPFDSFDTLMNYFMKVDEGNNAVDTELRELARQFGIFIGAFRIDDLKWANAPLIKGQVKIALVDLEKTGGSVLQVLGGDSNYPSIVHENHMDIFINEWKKFYENWDTFHGKFVPELKERAKKYRNGYFVEKKAEEDREQSQKHQNEMKEKYSQKSRTALALKINEGTTNEKVKLFGTVIIDGISEIFDDSISSQNYEEKNQIAIESRRLGREKLHSVFAADLQANGTYKDVNFYSPWKRAWAFEGCNWNDGCSKESYWHPVFLKGLLIPTLNYLKQSNQLADYEISDNGDIIIKRVIGT